MKLTPEEIEAQLNEIRLDYLASLDAKRATIVDSFTALCNTWDPATYDALYHVLHSLAGSAETFGLSELTDRARQLTQYFKQRSEEHALGVTTIREAEDMFSRLLASIDASSQETKRPGLG